MLVDTLAWGIAAAAWNCCCQAGFCCNAASTSKVSGKYELRFKNAARETGLVHDSIQIETDMVQQLLENVEAKLYCDSWVHQWTDGGKG